MSTMCHPGRYKGNGKGSRRQRQRAQREQREQREQWYQHNCRIVGGDASEMPQPVPLLFFAIKHELRRSLHQ